MTTPCATCRHDVLHLDALNRVIEELRAAAHAHRGLRVILIRHVKARRKAKQRYKDHLREHGIAISAFAAHLTEHAEGRLT
jgi:hypothetical protein